MTLLFEAAPEPLPMWQKHSTDLDEPRNEPTNRLTCLPEHICPWCMEDVGSVFCHCDGVRIARVEQAGTPEISIDKRGNQ